MPPRRMTTTTAATSKSILACVGYCEFDIALDDVDDAIAELVVDALPVFSLVVLDGV